MSASTKYTLFEKLFFILMIGFFIGTWWMFLNVREYLQLVPDLYKEEVAFAKAKNGFEWPKLTDFWISGVASVAVWATWRLNYWLFHDCLHKRIPVKDNSEAMRAIKADKVVDKMYSVIYFTFICIYGYIVLSKTEYLPPMLGGSWDNHLQNIAHDFPVISSDYLSSMRTYYLITLGYHFNSLRQTIWEVVTNTSRGDWVEMLLHHLLTVALYMFSYITNMTKMGSVIMFLHDWADIWTPFAKIFVELDMLVPALFGGVMIWTTWFWTRLVVFPQVIYYGIHIYPVKISYPNYLVEGHIDQQRHHHGNLFLKTCGVFLKFLQVLHVYWLGKFTKSVYKMAKGGFKKMEDAQENVNEF